MQDIHLPFYGLTDPGPGISRSSERPADGPLGSVLRWSAGGELHAATTISQHSWSIIYAEWELTLAILAL